MAKEHATRDSGDEIALLVIAALVVFIGWWQFDKIAFVWSLLRYPSALIAYWLPWDYPHQAGAFVMLDRRVIANNPGAMLQYDYTVNWIVALMEAFTIYRAGRILKGRIDYHRRIMSLNDVLALAARDNPHIRRFVGWDLTATDENIVFKRGAKNTYAVPLDWYEFALMAPPLGLEKSYVNATMKPCIVSGAILDEKTGRLHNGFFNNDLAAQAFEAQFGEPFAGVAQLTKPHEVKLLAMLREEFDKLYGDIIRESFEYKRLDAAPTDSKGVDRKESGKQTKERLARRDQLYKQRLNEEWARVTKTAQECHAYTITFFCGVFSAIKEYGTVPNNYFYWLCEHDRVLYLAMVSVGAPRQHSAPGIEAAGVFAHFEYEQMFQKAVPVKMIERPVMELKAACEKVSLLQNYQASAPFDPAKAMRQGNPQGAMG